MSVIWKANGVALDAKKLTLAGYGFRTHGISYVTLDAALDIDATEAFAYNEAVSLTRVVDGVSTTFFQGKIKPIHKSSRPEYEGHRYALEDAFADLEATIYQEPWNCKTGAEIAVKWTPRVVLGISGQTIGSAVTRIVEYAAGVGISIQMGACPAGEQAAPSEHTNITCAEALRICLKHHPDWIPWLDHSTTPPTLNISDVDEMTTRTFEIRSGSSAADFVDIVRSFSVTKREDLLPLGVRLCYEVANTYEDEVYRSIIVDKYPGDCADSGPRILSAFFPLEGMQMQLQKSRVKTRAIPVSATNITTLAEDEDAVKRFIKRKYPALKDAELSEFTVVSFDRSLVTEDVDAREHRPGAGGAFPADPEPISAQAPRLTVSSVTEVPNELVEGSIEDWMRRKVGKVHCKVELAATGSATDATKAAIAKGLAPFTVTATNATTKLYKGVSQWVAPEDIPAGIAEATYNAIHRSMLWEGSLEIAPGEVTATRYHGCRLAVTGVGSGIGAMTAPIHSVSGDITTGIVEIGFGPVPELAPADFLEMARILRARPVTWWSVEEREAATYGGHSHASAAGDTVSGFHAPETVFETGGAGAQTYPFQVTDASDEEHGLRVYVRPGMVESPWGWSDAPTGMHLDDALDANKCYFSFSTTGYVYLKFEITTSETPTLSGVSIHHAATTPTDTATAAYLTVAKVTVGTVGGASAITAIFQNIKSNLLHSLAFEGYSYPDFWRQMIGPISPSL